MKINTWSDPKVLQKNLRDIVDVFNNHINSNQSRFRENEAVYSSQFYKRWSEGVLKSEDVFEGIDNKFKNWLVKSSMNHTFTFIRLLQSMLVSNEPVVTATPTDSTQKSRDASNAADLFIRYSKTKYNIKDHIDSFILSTLIYGLGCLRVDWNPNKGELLDYNKKDNEGLFEGDVEIRNVLPDNFYIFSTSRSLLDRYGYIEKIYLELEEAKMLYPKFADNFQEAENLVSFDVINNISSELKNKTVIYEYIEKARALNGNKGRHILFTEDLTVIKNEENPYKHKDLPIVTFADIILPTSLFPLSIIDMLRDPQKQVNDIMSRILENIKLYSKVFLLVDRNANLNDDALNDNPVIPMEFSSAEGGVPPRPMEPPQLPQFVFQAYDMLVQMMQHIVGIREFSRGQMPKAVSGFTANLMIEADQKVFAQVHERYKTAVKQIYKLILSLVHQYWIEERMIYIADEENEVDVKAFIGTNLEGGYDISIDYGSSLPIDPAARRQMVQELATIFGNLGVKLDPTRLIDLLKLGDVMGTYDIPKMASKRQRKEIETMKETGQASPISYDTEDHAAHYAEIFSYFQTAEYEVLNPNVKEALKQHANDHMAANKKQQQFPGMSEAEVEQAIQMQQTNMQAPGMMGAGAAMPMEGMPSGETINPEEILAS